jgi:hypothetical protein
MTNKFKVLTILILFVFLGNGFSANLIDMIKQMTEDNLKGYTQPLITSFGEATGSGLYHTAATHGLLGFDIGLKGMWVPIPESAKSFVAKVMVLHDTSFLYETTATTATVFGKTGQDPVTVPPGSNATIPPAFPGGLNVPGFPFLVPQLSIGLIKGTEIMVRYIPTITYYYSGKGADIQIFGAGLTIGLNKFLNLKLLPVDVAVQGAYQMFNIGDIIKSSTFSANVHASKTFLILTPYIGLGYENTKMNFDYTFTYQLPGQQPTPVPVKVSLTGENHFRAVVGMSLKLAVLLIHADYNISKYPSFSGGFGFSLR